MCESMQLKYSHFTSHKDGLVNHLINTVGQQADVTYVLPIH